MATNSNVVRLEELCVRELRVRESVFADGTDFFCIYSAGFTATDACATATVNSVFLVLEVDGNEAVWYSDVDSILEIPDRLDCNKQVVIVSILSCSSNQNQMLRLSEYVWSVYQECSRYVGYYEIIDESMPGDSFTDDDWIYCMCNYATQKTLWDTTPYTVE